MNNNIHRLLIEARKLIATMDPKPGHPLDGVDAMIHAVLMELERSGHSTETQADGPQENAE